MLHGDSGSEPHNSSEAHITMIDISRTVTQDQKPRRLAQELIRKRHHDLVPEDDRRRAAP